MRFMNEYEVQEAAERRMAHPTLGPATRTLRNLCELANHCSDGWCYWPKPMRAASSLMALIDGDGSYEARYGPRADVTAAQVKAAYRPIRSFLTRNELSCELVEPAHDAATNRVRESVGGQLGLF
ncbi:MAG: hypothetical protein M1522_04755 [Actinobacteria bacterium]|jgi:hypothetical protein|nr:hypothetical protein [Actinomycetota bacterium]